MVVLTLLQVHTGWRLSYVNPDVPTEMMIYTQTSPDVTRVVDEVSQLSYSLTGGDGIEVWYDSGVSWPMQWYLRNFPNKRFVGSSINGPPENAPVVIVSTQYEANFDKYLTGYTATEYVLRWWFPEEIYRDFAIAPEIPGGPFGMAIRRGPAWHRGYRRFDCRLCRTRAVARRTGTSVSASGLSRSGAAARSVQL